MPLKQMNKPMNQFPISKVDSEDSNKADEDYERIILEVPQVYWNHNGGDVSYIVF